MFRIDPISGEYTIIATERVNRPQDFGNDKSTKNLCPFCVGNENMTPPPIMEVKDDNKNWCIRIIPNKYPFISNKESDVEKDIFYNQIDSYGNHDVLIDTPNHNESIFEFSKTHMQKVFFALQQRQQQIETDKNIKYVHIFKNQGNFAGASKEHSHWQIVGVPIVPEKQLKLIEGNRNYIKQKGICGFCDIISHELEHKERIIAINENFIAITPFASKFPYEIWILPKTHFESFLLFDKLHINDLADLFQKIIKGLKCIFNDINFNVCFEGSPNIEKYKGIHHWYLQIIPRITGLAGFELGTACYINIYSPELAAKNLRDNL